MKIKLNKQTILEDSRRAKTSKSDIEKELYTHLDAGFINEDILQDFLSKLASHFTSSVSSKAKTDSFSWIAQAVSKDESRKTVQYVYVDSENLVATDENRLHFIPKPKNMSEGFYDPKTKIMPAKMEDCKFPNYRQVIPHGLPSKESVTLADFVPAGMIDNRRVVKYKDFKLREPYIKQAFAADKCCSPYISKTLVIYMLRIANITIAIPCFFENFNCFRFFINKYPNIKEAARSILTPVKNKGVDDCIASLLKGKQQDQIANKKNGIKSIKEPL